MLKEAFEFLIGLGKPVQLTDLLGRELIVLPGKGPVMTKRCVVENIEVSTLSALLELHEETTHDKYCDLFYIHVESHKTVKIVSAPDETSGGRVVYAIATHSEPVFEFDKWMDIESFIIGLHSKFLQTEERDALIKFVSSISFEGSVSTDDDGISQTVETRKGVAMKQNSTVPNPVTLQPRRTFREVEQPESQFVFRINKDSMKVALFEADGGKWKLDAIENIAQKLNESKSGAVVLS